MKFVEVDGVRTRYASAGQGRPLFLLHGVGLSGDCFIRNMDALGEHCAVYAPDMLGHGFTEAMAFGGIAPQIVMARHVLRLADVLGLDSFTAGGSSFGALVAALMYLEQPERVDGLILVGSGSAFHTAEEQRSTLQAAAANAQQAMADPTLESCRARLVNILYDPAAAAEEMLPVQLTSYALPDRHSAYQATIDGSIAALDIAESRIFTSLEQLDVPTLVIVGRDDIRSSWEMHVKGVERMPKATLHIYEKCGHMPFMEHPERFNGDVLEFLAALRQ